MVMLRASELIAAAAAAGRAFCSIYHYGVANVPKKMLRRLGVESGGQKKERGQREHPRRASWRRLHIAVGGA